MKRKATVLFVDDDVDFLTANQLAFEAAGYEVHTATSSAEAVKLAVKFKPDVAVLDVVMQRPDEGFLLARQLRDDERTKSVQLVLLSSVNEINRAKGLGFRFSDHDRDDRWLPVDRVLDKPVKPRKLMEVVEKLREKGL